MLKMDPKQRITA
jgi:hypothetical protein